MHYKFETTKQRSDLMKKIKSKNTKPEKKLAKKLWSLGLRYRKYLSCLPGKPDIVITKYRIVIFVDGEFWHGYLWNIKKERISRNRDYWIPKIEKNIERDLLANEQLKKDGWTVIRFWEYEIRKDLDSCIEKILQHIKDY